MKPTTANTQGLALPGGTLTPNPNLQRLPFRPMDETERRIWQGQVEASRKPGPLTRWAAGEPVELSDAVIGVDMAKPGTDRTAVMHVPGGGFVMLLHSEVTRAELMGQAGTNEQGERQ
jgi:hypothetical protein